MRKNIFFTSIGRCHPYDDENIYCQDSKKLKLVMRIMTELIMIAEGDFYGCNIKIEGLDALLSIEMSSFYIDMLDEPERVISLLKQADELSFVPGDSHMTVRVRINGIFERRKDEGWF